jgi:Zn-dependent membrane protease YugP
MRIFEFYYLYLSTAFDYVLYALPALLVTIWARLRNARACAEGSRMLAASSVNGSEAAVELLKAGGLDRVAIEPVEGELTNHYDPAQMVLRLSPAVYAGGSLAAIGIAAHEAGHAIQDAKRYPGLVVRSVIVPLAAIGSTVCWLLVLAGLMIGLAPLVLSGIVLFSLNVALQIINLPVEFNASRRAREMLRLTRVISAEEEPVVAKVLEAAAWAHVAAALVGVLTLRFDLWPSRFTTSPRP